MRVCLYLPDGRRMVGDINPLLFVDIDSESIPVPPYSPDPPLGIVWGEINLEFFVLNGHGVYVYKACSDVLTPTHHLSDDDLASFEEYGRD